MNRLEKLFSTIEVPKFQADRHKDLCSGSPFMANHVGKVLAHSSGEASEVLSQETLFIRRFYVNLERENPDKSSSSAERISASTHRAFSSSFGYERFCLQMMLKAIAKKVETADLQITRMRFRKIVKDLKKDGLLKGEYTLNITPKALHIKLWTEWWDTYSDEEFNLEDFHPRI